VWPKEHGAYGQLLFPLVTSLAVGGSTIPALLAAVAAAGLFVSHEPLLVLIGQRGPRAARETGRRAAVWWTLSIVIAAAAGLAAFWLAPLGTRDAFLWPLLPMAVTGAALLLGREKTTTGELAVAATFASFAVLVCRLSGAPMSTAAAVALTFFGISSANVLAVRTVILRVRGGGDPAAVRRTRRLFFAVTGTMLMILLAGAVRGALPWAPLAAVAPSWTVSTAIALNPPAPTQLRRIGWRLMATSFAAAVVLIGVLFYES
jgi:hypothetical protein